MLYNFKQNNLSVILGNAILFCSYILIDIQFLNLKT